MSSVLYGPSRRHGLLAELRQRQPQLTGFGLLLLALAVPTAVAGLIDSRTLEGVDVWLKPLKFMLSVALFSLTMAWFFGYLPEERRHARPARLIVWTILIAGTFEIAYITLQGARGQASHFNNSSPLYIGLYALMGIGALAITATTLPLAREIRRHALPGLSPAFRTSLIVGLVATFALGASSGILISQMGRHVGELTGGAVVPLFGWSRSIGDLRVAHFFGLHAQQILPIAGALLAHYLPRRALPLFWLFATGYVVLTLFAALQALAGEPLLPA